jgi:hypothetical protein
VGQDADSSRRRTERYRVHLSVRYQRARDFVVEYARNLSAGGLFIRGAHHLAPLREVTVELQLPGFETFQLGCQVAHVVAPEQVEGKSYKAGAGLAIVSSPPGFKEALAGYFRRLGRRRDYCVMAADEPCRKLLEDSGYRAVAAPPVGELVAAIARSEYPVLAVVVARAQEKPYADAAARAGLPGVVRGIDYLEEIEDLLGELDQDL